MKLRAIQAHSGSSWNSIAIQRAGAGMLASSLKAAWKRRAAREQRQSSEGTEADKKFIRKRLNVAGSRNREKSGRVPRCGSGATPVFGPEFGSKAEPICPMARHFKIGRLGH